jgi:N-carbamoyl-L-amino-acid hydrolase
MDGGAREGTSGRAFWDPAWGAEYLDDFKALSSFGATAGGGVDRQAATPEEAATRTWFAAWLEDRGFTIAYDRIGNLFGMKETVRGAPYILVGSHLDSQPLAGRFDGAYGVLGGAHAAHRAGLALGGQEPRFNLAVVAWFNEEGSRFKPSMMGSSVYTGTIPLEVALATTDRHGVTVRDALALTQQVGDDDVLALDRIAGYVEMHVEQGPDMEANGIVIGPVVGTWCAYKYEVCVTGAQSHSGSTPMADRRDALLAASHLVVELNGLIDEFETEELHTAVGELNVLPNSPVVIAREVRLLMDIRARDTATLRRAFASLEQRITAIEARTHCTIEIISKSTWESGTFPEGGVQLTAQLADELGHTNASTVTLAGHDATNMNEKVPTVLFFVPSVDGLSHAEGELTSDEDMVAGLSLMTNVLHRLAGEGIPTVY